MFHQHHYYSNQRTNSVLFVYISTIVLHSRLLSIQLLLHCK
jgi:hypothetical protein